MAIIPRSKGTENDWYKIEDVLSWQPGSKNCGLLVPVDADTDNTALTNSLRGAGVTAVTGADSTIVNGVLTSGAAGTTVNLNPDPRVAPTGRNIIYAWVFCKNTPGQKAQLYGDTTGYEFGIQLSATELSGNNQRGIAILDFGDYVNTMLTSTFGVLIADLGHGTIRSANMEGSIVRCDFNFAADNVIITSRTGQSEREFTDSYLISSANAGWVFKTLTLSAGLQCSGAGIMQFTEAEDAAIMSDWRNVWDRMETEWLAGNRVLPKEFIR